MATAAREESPVPRAANGDDAVLDVEILGAALELGGGDGERLLSHLGGGVGGRAAAENGDAARESADACGMPSVSPGKT